MGKKQLALGLGDVELCDAIDGLARLDPGSVDLVLSDLPSGRTKAKTDKAPSLPEMWAAFERVLAPKGNVVLMASHFEFAGHVQRSAPRSIRFRYERIWEKTLGTQHMNASRMPIKVHEYILVFSRVPKATYNPQCTEGHEPARVASYKGRRSSSENYGSARPSLWLPGVEGNTSRQPRSVLKVPGVGTNAARRTHHQQKPELLIGELVLTYSNEGDLVVDPYAGSGKVGEEGHRLGRRTRCFDHDPRFGRKMA